MNLTRLPRLDAPDRPLFTGKQHKFEQRNFSIRNSLRIPVYELTYLLTLAVLRRMSEFREIWKRV